ncbi:gliding motility-associated C-terminal domain-containing protein, partial [Flavobacterium saliperosum]
PNNYVITRTWVASDSCGNTVTHTQTINVEDTTAPVFNGILPSDSTVECSDLSTAAVLTATDNCGTATVTFNETRVDGDCPNNYVITRTWTASDSCGNAVIHTQTINVQDTTAPVFNETLPLDSTVNCNAIRPAIMLTATDNCGTATVTFNETRVDGGCPNNYSITRTWTSSDSCGNTVAHTQTITVEDTTAPVFNEVLPADITVECNSIIPAPTTLTATDNCGAASVQFDEETINGSCPGNAEIIRTWRTMDACGNENVHIQTITVIDTTPPVFEGILPQNLSVECGSIPVAQTLTATDSCGEVTITFEENEVEGDCKSKYELIRTWTATDSCGNTTTHTQTLNLNCHVKVFNAVSPDGDGSNDIFYLEGIECFPNNSVEIFNRWGAKVFETQGYDNTSNVFRGRSEGRNTISKNEELPTGTYFYVLHYDFSSDGNQTEKIEKTGYLYVVNK